MRAIKGDPPKSEVVKRMLASGNWKLGPNGELLRVSAEDMAKNAADKVLAEAAQLYPSLLNLDTPPQREDRLQQGEERSLSDKGVDALRALSQPINYLREVGEGNYLPTQAELESSGVSPVEQVVAFANPMDHVYATLAMAGFIDDPNYDNEYSSAALLGLIAGSSGEKVPKALEKTVDLLRKEGVKNYSDIRRTLLNNKDSDVIQELKAIKDKAIEFSKHIQKFGHEAYSQAKSSAPRGLSTWGTGGNAVNAATNYMIESDPNALLKFTPEGFDAGAFDASMQKFADQYLTGFRSVKAKDEANALKYITNPIGTGHGGMNLGPGLYHGTRSSQIRGTDGTARPDYGPHLGVIRIAPEIGVPGSSASQIIQDLQKYEFLGDTQGTYDLRHGLHKRGVYPGFKTSQEIRVSRSGTPVNLLDYANTPEGRANLFNAYNPDYYGAENNPNKPRGLELLPQDYSKGGVMGMRPIRKRNRLMEMLDARKARRAKGGDQVINTSNTFTSELEPDDPLFQEIVQAQGPYPIGAAEVVGTPTQYEEADLSKAALLALREGAGMVPIVGEALDVAEFEKIRRTGKDFYEDEADPTMYAGLTAAGMLLPNIIERPARAIGRGAKKLFKFGGDKLSRVKPSSINKPFLDMKGLAPNEVGTFRQMNSEDLVGQAKIDMSLHDMAQPNDYWTDAQKKYLEDDKVLKQRFIKLIEDGGGSQKEIQSVIDGITKDQDIHAKYINEYLVKNPDLASNAGSPAWHRNWIKVYDGWLEELKRMKGKSQPSNSMAQGGVIYMKKKPTGMSVIRK